MRMQRRNERSIVVVMLLVKAGVDNSSPKPIFRVPRCLAASRPMCSSSADGFLVIPVEHSSGEMA